jgi:lysophospholipase L1-like esterase
MATKLRVFLAMAAWSAGLLAGPPVDARHAPHWVGTWACAGVPLPAKAAAVGDPSGLQNATVRDVVHVTLGGSTIRLRLSNEQGDAAITFGSVHVAESGIVYAKSQIPTKRPGPGQGIDAVDSATEQDSIKPGTDHAVTFAGAASVTVPAGHFVWSDPVKVDVSRFSSLAVSIFVPKQSAFVPTIHATALSTNYVAEGDQTSALTLEKAKKLKSWMFLTGVDVEATADARAVVTLGDSITDGMISTVDANLRWPDDLARRLAEDPKTKNVSVLNAGISGGRILYPQAGPSMIERFDRDVLGQDGVKYVILFAGINDINHSQNRADPAQHETADDLIAGMKKIIAMGHARGLRVYGATITPEGGSQFAKPGGEAIRQAVNAWIRSGQGFDAYFDFDKAVAVPGSSPEILKPEYGGAASGNIHLFDPGYQALADAIDLKAFE